VLRTKGGQVPHWDGLTGDASTLWPPGSERSPRV